MAFRKTVIRLGGFVALGLAAACGGETGGTGGGATTGTGTGTGGGTPAICTAGSRWTAGTQAFREATSDWGLDVAGAIGVRLIAVDFDGDGWVDLVVRAGGSTPDDFAPGGQRRTWLLRNTGKGKFEDVTEKSGFRKTRATPEPNIGRPGEIVAFADIDNDGDLDAFTGLPYDAKNPSPETSEILINNGDGTFALGPEASPVRLAKKDATAGASFVDYDRDGNVDLWVTHNSLNYLPQQDHLYRGDGAGNFVDVIADLGMKTKSWGSAQPDVLNQGLGHSNAWSAAACDLNGDGEPELLAASYGRAPNHLWQKTPGGGYVNRSVDSGYAFDDRQDWTDNESARCYCKLHPDAADCAGVPPPKYIVCTTDDDAFRWQHATDREPFRLGGNSGSTMCGDIDNDGDIDLVTSEIRHWDVGSSSDPAELLLNDGGADVKFSRPGNEATGLDRKHSGAGWDEGIMTGSLFDFDNDGWLDLYWGGSDYPGNHGLLYHQDGPAHFEAVPIDVGIDHHRSHGSAVADFDRDGDLDIVVGHSSARCDQGNDCYPTQQVRFFENVIGQGGNFIQLALKGGPGTNRAAIGARVTAKAGDVTMTREVGGGYGHYGAQDDLVVHFGLGAACEAEITVRWPDAALTTQTFKLPAGYRFSLVQGEQPVVVPKPE